MQTASRIWNTLAWIALIFSLFMQTLVAFGIATGGTDFSIVPIVVSSVLLLVATIVTTALPKKKGIPLIAAGVAGMLFIITAILVSKEFPILIHEVDMGRGITPWQFVYRHLSPLLVPLFLLGYWICWRTQQVIDTVCEKEPTPDSYLNLGDFQMGKLDE